MADTTPPAGWYDDVQVPGSQRFWNGHAWTDERRRVAGSVLTAPRPHHELRVIPALFSPNQVGGAAFFGGPMAGVVLLYMSLTDLGKKKEARSALIWGLLVFIGMIGLAWFVAEVPEMLVPVASGFAFRMAATKVAGGAINEHFVVGGPKRSFGTAALLTIAAAFVTVALMVGVMVVFDPAFWALT